MSARLVPAFPAEFSPATWDSLTLLAATIFLEAEGEPDEGKLGVAWVIRNRADQWKQELRQVILAPRQFSCWNLDYQVVASRRLAQSIGMPVVGCWRAAAGVLWRLLTDPTEGASHYLNVEATKAARARHDLPSWAADPEDPTRVNQAAVRIVIGRHTFLAA